VKTLLLIVLLVLFLSAILINKASKTIGVKELRRRARSNKEKSANNIYKLVSLDESLKLFLWLVGGLSAAGLLLMLADISPILSIVAVLVSGWLVLSDRPLNSEGFLWKITAIISVPTFKIVSFLHPLLSKLSRFLRNVRPIKVHSGLYDKDDLLELINVQKKLIQKLLARCT
jgi:hypothetical protein